MKLEDGEVLYQPAALAYCRKPREAKQIGKCHCVMQALREVKCQNPTMEFPPTLNVGSSLQTAGIHWMTQPILSYSQMAGA